MKRPLLDLLDRVWLRRPFEGASAERYHREERGAFADLDARLLGAWAPELGQARVLVDVGAGEGAFARQALERHPELRVVAIEPSRRATTRAARHPRLLHLRGAAEALPLPDGSADLALCFSSLRHVADRAAALRGLRRVLRPDGLAWIVELDAEAEAERVRAHTRRLTSRRARLLFRALVLATCPPARVFVELARATGWSGIDLSRDPVQPVWLMRLRP